MNKQQLAAKIWESANQMRSKIEANEYKDYILGFIFYKYLSEKQVKYAQSKGMSAADIAQLSEEDADTCNYIRGELGYFIAYEHLFDTWLAKGGDFDVSDVRDALSAFSRLIHNNHKKLFDGIFTTLETGLSKLGDSAQKQTKAIRDLLQLIKEIPMDGKQDYDVLGYIYEYLIEKFAANAGKKAGEFYTPSEVSQLMSEIVAHHCKDHTTIDIYDPTSGSGSLLINIGHALAKYVNDKNAIKYYAQELKVNTYNLTRMNLIMRGIIPNNIETRNGDTLEEDWPFFDESDPINSYDPLYLDAVVSNPPYSQAWDSRDKENDPRYANFGLAPKTKADYAFLLHDLYHLKPQGIMTIILPHGVLFRGGEEGAIRKQLIEKNHIETIIGLPANIFFGTSIPTIIMVLRQERPTDDVLIIDASKHFLKVGKNNKLQASDIKRITDTVVAREERTKYATVVSKQSIRDNDYNLNIPRYVDSADDPESWDLHATMLGGIPQHEIEKLAHYWHAFPALRAVLFRNTNSAYAELNTTPTTLKQTISEHSEVTAFIADYQRAFTGFDSYLNTQLIENHAQLNLAGAETELGNELFTRLQPVALIDKYHAYQLLNNQWQSISADLEILQTEGFAASKQVDPHIVTKKIKGKDTEVQEGWCGHILPFELVQSTHLSGELAAIQNQENRLAEISGELESILDTLSEEDKEADTVKDSKDGFINAVVSKTAKGFKAERSALNKQGDDFDEDSYEVKILQVDSLNNEEKALKQAVKADSAALHLQTKATIEALSDEQVNSLLEQKWISPLIAELNQLPSAIITELSNKLQTLADKYATTYAKVANDIKATEHSLAAMLEELTGDEADLQGLAELKAFLKGE